MAGDLSCAAKRKAKERSSEYINCRIDQNDQSLMKTMLQPQQTRNGLRVYKIVILGDGGVGKSGKCIYYCYFNLVLLLLLLLLCLFMWKYLCVHIFSCDAHKKMMMKMIIITVIIKQQYLILQEKSCSKSQVTQTRKLYYFKRFDSKF